MVILRQQVNLYVLVVVSLRKKVCMRKLILVRHGESVWNMENRFTGWEDPLLSEKGEAEALCAGKVIYKAGLKFDIAYTSMLTRAIQTLHLLEINARLSWVPELHHWRLNERHYGALQGLNKAETIAKFGAEQVLQWRRSYAIVPPLLDPSDSRNPIFDHRYAGIDKEVLPLGESLEMTIHRVLPFWQDYIAPSLLQDKIVLVAAHGNSLRALVKYLKRLDDDEIVKLEIPTGVPQLFELDNSLSFIRSYYL